MKTIDVITMILIIIGGLNWGLVGLFDWNLVAALFGSLSWLSRFIYILVGISAVYQAFAYWSVNHRWGGAATPKTHEA